MTLKDKQSRCKQGRKGKEVTKREGRLLRKAARKLQEVMNGTLSMKEKRRKEPKARRK